MNRVVFFVALAAVAWGKTVKDEDVKFYLTNSKLSYEQISTGTGTLDINPQKQVKIICHGWVDSIDSDWYVDAKAEYVRRGMTNVIGVDWGTHANGLYSSAVKASQPVGEIIGKLVLYLHNTYGVPLSQIHLIGHSLGAHISGFAGKYVLATSGKRIGRITGLDPAGPSWEKKDADSRLAVGDADFVDVMHTDGGNLGLDEVIGDVDYYPNGGVSRQNGCGILAVGCSHNRAPKYFYESINSNGFVTVQCSSEKDFNNGNCDSNPRTVMGENVDTSLRGTFYLSTNKEAPFAIGTL
ncbi:lipoprotein lipase-like [Onthophagus taurus]|uniref:lipoprotein lipase-like n=1 Tax=Onthophagus taurus TaxID=166361 RepID=UPI000C203A19|nr:lipoprotein lipase-like [Onthophagus taurus]